MRSLSIFALLAASASFASANIISIGCSQNVYTGQNGSGQSSTCGGFAVPAGFNITNVTYEYAVDFQFNNFNPGTKSIVAALDAVGANDVSGLVVNTGNRPVSGQVAVAAANWAAFVAGTSIATSYTGASDAVTGATFDTQVTFTYEAQVQGTPEPSTLALVGGVLVLAGLRKFRK